MFFIALMMELQCLLAYLDNPFTPINWSLLLAAISFFLNGIYHPANSRYTTLVHNNCIGPTLSRREPVTLARL